MNQNLSESEGKTVRELQAKLENTEEELKNTMEENRRLREHQNVDHIPQGLKVDDKVGIVRKDHLSTLTEANKRGYGILVEEYGEVIRRRLEKNHGIATMRFYINAKDPVANLEYLVPVNFTVNFERKTTSLTLDEARV